MLTVREAVYSIYGVYRLARLDPGGLQYLDRTPEGAMRSVQAVLFLLPALAVVLVLRDWERLGQASALPMALAYGTAFVAAWAAFALAMHHVARLLGREDRYAGWLCAYDWSHVVQFAVVLPTIAIAELGLLPADGADFLYFLVDLALLAYLWYVARTALGASGAAAAGIVLLDLLIGTTLTAVAQAMLFGPVPPQ